MKQPNAASYNKFKKVDVFKKYNRTLPGLSDLCRGSRKIYPQCYNTLIFGKFQIPDLSIATLAVGGLGSFMFMLTKVNSILNVLVLFARQREVRAAEIIDALI